MHNQVKFCYVTTHVRENIIKCLSNTWFQLWLF